MIDLGTPIPKDTPTRYEPFAWPDGDRTVLPTPEPQEADLYATLEHRRSNRDFRPLPFRFLSSLLWYSGRCLGKRASGLGFDLERRPSPSAGAIHPIHTLVRRSDCDLWERYVPKEHALCEVLNAHQAFEPLVQFLSEAFSPEAAVTGTILLWVAEPGLTDAKYSNADSLIWRDAGILQGTVGIVAAGLGLPFCLAGATGNEEVIALTNRRGDLAGVGTALVGQSRYSAA